MEKPFTHKPGSLKQSLLGKSAVANVPTPSNIMPLSRMRLVPNRFKGGVPINLSCVLKMKDQEWNGLTGLAVGVKQTESF